MKQETIFDNEQRGREGLLTGAHYKGCHIYDMACVPQQQHHPGVPQYPTRVNSMILVICKRGYASVEVNMNRYTISDNSIFFNGPNCILNIGEEGMSPRLEEGCIVVMDPEMAEKMDFDLKELLPLTLRIQNNHVVSISDKECDILMGIARDLIREITMPEDEPFYHEVLKNYFEVFFYKLCNILGKALKASAPSDKSVKNRSEEYFHRFIQILNEHYKRERTLSFYAEQLCITPKYLTTLIKKVSGRSASEWIDSYVILEAKNLLRYSSMSIQEVAYHLNFPNQSFFGKYFKHQTGYSPSAYKMLK